MTKTKRFPAFTHRELVDIAYWWVLKSCGCAFKEMKCLNTEIADVIGFNQHGTFVIEAKVSRSDFLADKRKPFRKDGGLGDWRFYIAPKGMIEIAELPDMWGLIEVRERGKIHSVFNPFGSGNIYSLWRRNIKNDTAERNAMYSALRRLFPNRLNINED